MTTALLAPYLTQEFFGSSGAPLTGGFLFSYQAGTNTPIATFTDSTGATPNANPIVLNARGECSVWILPNVAYKFVLEDSAGNVIWSRDSVTNAQLLSLFGGVDTGAVNAVILNFTANFTALINGIVLYFIPANTNTGPATLNVNGLGVISIVNPNGAPLSAGQIIGGQVAAVMYYNGNWLLISATVGIPTTGSFTANFTGGTGYPSVTATYILNGSLVTLTLPRAVGTSNSTGFTMTGLPPALQPATIQTVWYGPMQDNGVTVAGLAQLAPGQSSIVLWKDAAGNGTDWTNTGAKGVGTFFNLTAFPATMTYSLK